MSGLSSLLPINDCPSCEGSGTVWLADATRPGESFAQVCRRCGGSGTVVPGLRDHEDPAPRCDRQPGCRYCPGHQGPCLSKEGQK